AVQDDRIDPRTGDYEHVRRAVGVRHVLDFLSKGLALCRHLSATATRRPKPFPPRTATKQSKSSFGPCSVASETVSFPARGRPTRWSRSWFGVTTSTRPSKTSTSKFVGRSPNTSRAGT